MLRPFRISLAACSIVALLFGLSSAGCGDSGGGGGAIPFDAGGDAGFADGGGKTPLPDGGFECRGSLTRCGGECVDLQTNIDHCGECGNSCGSGGLFCGDGECQCIEDEFSNCSGTCVDLSSSTEHCGSCGNSCGEMEVCKEATCQSRTRVRQVVEETNEVRSMGYDCGEFGEFDPAAALEGNEELHEAAQMHAENMADNQFFSHTYRPPDCNPESSDQCHDFAWRIGQTDYQGRPVGENIARGQQSAQSVVQGWAESDGHCRNMLNPRPNEIGVGVADGPGGPYWVQVFGRK